jgi:hypothetical protein
VCRQQLHFVQHAGLRQPGWGRGFKHRGLVAARRSRQPGG